MCIRDSSREDQAAAQAPITNDQLTSATKLVDTYAVILTSDTVLDKTISNLNLNMRRHQYSGG